MNTIPARKWLDEQVYDVLSQHQSHKIQNSAELELALRKWQLSNLYKTLTYAQNNTLAYRQSLQAYAKLMFNDCSSLNLEELNEEIIRVLQEIAPTYPQDLSSNTEAFLAVPHHEVSGIITTSGTTAKSKRIFYSEADMLKTIEFFRYGMSYLVHKQSKVALLMSGERVGSVGYLLQEAMRKNGIACYVLGFVHDEDLIISKLIELEITCIVGVPSHILSLAKHSRASELNVANVLLSGDAVTPIIRQTIASYLDCEVFVHYGLTEFVLGGAVECNYRQSCHLRELDLLAEIVNPQMQSLPKGTWGELVLTSLAHQNAEAMPLIRYKTGDYARILAQRCTCGSILERLEVLGRIENAFSIDKQTSIHITQLDNILYAFAWLKSYNVLYYTKSKKLFFDIELLVAAPKEAFSILTRALEENLPQLQNIKLVFNKLDRVKIKEAQSKKNIQQFDK